MDQRAVKVIDAIKQRLSHNSPDELSLLIIFGSQVRNTETPESDLDVLYVARTAPRQHGEFEQSVMAEARVEMKINIVPRTLDSFKRRANMYGMPEYDALHTNHGDGIIVLYKSDEGRDVLDSILGTDSRNNDGEHSLDIMWCVRQWLDDSRGYIALGLSLMEEKGTTHSKDAEEICNTMYDSIRFSINASLLYHGILFPRTHDIRALRDMLPTGSRMPLDFDALRKWGSHTAKHSKKTQDEQTSAYEHTDDDVCAATQAAQSTYDFVSKEMDSSPPAH